MILKAPSACCGAVRLLSGEAPVKSLYAFIPELSCNARNGEGNSGLFKESHDEAVHNNPLYPAIHRKWSFRILAASI